MAYRDLREFLDRLEAEGQLARVRRPVETRFEIAAGIRRMSDTKGPALRFENVIGHVDAGRRARCSPTGAKALLALDVRQPAEGTPSSCAGCTSPIPPQLVTSGPCQEVVLTGDDVDLFALPLPGLQREGRRRLRHRRAGDQPRPGGRDGQRLDLPDDAGGPEPPGRHVPRLPGPGHAHRQGGADGRSPRRGGRERHRSRAAVCLAGQGAAGRRRAGDRGRDQRGAGRGGPRQDRGPADPGHRRDRHRGPDPARSTSRERARSASSPATTALPRRTR